jgi:anti-sigma regulatory factor (Ser/Thr protein kinase)
MAGYSDSIEVVPSAKRLVGSLRDLGYNTVEAVADLVDNCVAAGARNVNIAIEFDGGDSWIRITDDGRGMDGGTITEAMRYGSVREYENEDLGKFGLGLKTASMSQCRRLSVASRVAKTTARMEARQLDLDYVEETDSWRVRRLGPTDRPPPLVEPLAQRPGTVVLWERLDRILNYKNPGSEWARAKLLGLGEDLDDHLGMVFHRFLNGEVARRARLKITINGTSVEPWDPFARDEKDTEKLDVHEFEIHTGSGSGIVRLEPFILPREDRFSTPTAHFRAGGPNRWNRQQGFYIYRADRLIQSGGWSRVRTPDEHTKLARVALLFTPDLDAAFGLNVAKMRVILPTDLKDQIKPTVDRVVKRAKGVYDAKQPGAPKSGTGSKTHATPSGGGTHGEASASPSAGSNSTGEATARTRRKALETAARSVKHEDALVSIIKALSTDAPEVARDLGW